MRLAAAALCPLLFLAPPAVAQQRVTVIVLPAGARQAVPAGQLAEAIDEGVARSRELCHWRDLVASKSIASAAANLRQKIDDTLALVKGRESERAPLAELAAAVKAAAPTATRDDVQSAQVAMAAVAWSQGDAPLAEQRLTDALASEPNLPPIEVAEPAGWAEAWNRARFAVSDKARGELSIQSEPAGARVTVDGIPRGTTPAVVQGLVQGPHLVQLDLFGYALQGEVVRVVGAEGEYSGKLTFGDLFAEADLKQAVLAATLNNNGKFAAQLAGRLGLDYLVLGWLAPKGRADTLALAAVRLRDGKVLAAQVLPLEGDEYGQAGARASSLAVSLLEGKTGSHGKDGESAKPKDPLDGKDGTEDW